MSHLARKHRPVIAIDRFLANDHYLVEYFATHCYDVRYGESFLPVFLTNLSNYLPHIEVRAGELVRTGRIEQPIEILVVDIAKSTGLNAYVTTQWFSKLIPSQATVIHQDFYAPSHLWIAITMGVLSEYFTVITDSVGESAVFRLERTIPRSRLEEAARIEPRSTYGLRALDAVLERISESARPPLLIMKALINHRVNRSLEARRILDSLLALSAAPTYAKWNQWLGMAIVAINPNLLTTAQRTAQVYLEDAYNRLGN